MLIRMGSSGPIVRDVQEMLNVAVPLFPSLTLDGIFGPKTNERVVAFQSQAKLVADGIVGPMTSKSLVGAVIKTLRFS
ncbi:MAG: peptidoglycan-binding domain-containing protein [Bryobacteraceae bacterium]